MSAERWPEILASAPADRDITGEIPEQHHRAGPPFHRENHTVYPGFQGLPFSRSHTRWYRSSSHDLKKQFHTNHASPFETFASLAA